jgi:hypothetical protein
MAFLKQVPPEGELRSTYFGKLYCEVTQCNGKKKLLWFFPNVGWVLDGYHKGKMKKLHEGFQEMKHLQEGVGISLSKMSQNPQSVDYFPSSV